MVKDMVLNIAVCDDEIHYRQKIQGLIELKLKNSDYHNYKIDIYESCEVLLANKQKIKEYEVIFLDINFENKSGMEAASEIVKINKDVFLIFVTSFIEYSLDGYRVNAFRYILKNNMEFFIDEAIEALLERLSQKRAILEFDFVEEKMSVKVEDIIYITSEKHKLVFYIQTETGIKAYSIYSKLDTIEDELKKYYFIRIHKSYLCNYRHIVSFRNYEVSLDIGLKLTSSRNRYTEARNKYYELKGGLK